ncbi:MAG: T9SS type A sorting domain-containing protein [candidate division WOR-3 bacterium]
MCAQRRDFNRIGLVPCFLVLLFFIGTGFAQITWQKTYGGAGGEKGFCVDQTFDGGYIIVGVTTSFGNAGQVYLIKTDSLGDTLWTKVYGDVGYEWGYFVEQTADGGYIIAGATNSFGNGYQIYLIKTDSLGDTLWTKTYGDTTNEYGRSVQQTMDGGFIVVGSGYGGEVYDPVYLIKTDSIGNILWSKIYQSGEGFYVRQTTDGGYVIAAHSLNMQAYLIKTNSSGDTLWTKTYGSTTSAWEYIYAAHQTTDYGFICVGYASNFYPEYTQIYLVKTDSLGDTLWTRLYGDVGNSAIEGFSVQQTYDGGYIVAGITSAIGFVDIYLVKVDSVGDSVWSKTYGGADIDWGHYVQQTSDSGFIIVGHTLSFGNNRQIYLIKTDKDGNVAGIGETGRQGDGETRRLEVYPNPFRNRLDIRYQIGDKGQKISLKIYDVTGRLVKSFNHLTIRPFNHVVWDGKDDFGRRLPAGVYFCRLEIDETVVATKVVELE